MGQHLFHKFFFRRRLRKVSESYRPHEDPRRDRIDCGVHDPKVSEDSFRNRISEDPGIRDDRRVLKNLPALFIPSRIEDAAEPVRDDLDQK